MLFKLHDCMRFHSRHNHIRQAAIILNSPEITRYTEGQKKSLIFHCFTITLHVKCYE